MSQENDVIRPRTALDGTSQDSNENLYETKNPTVSIKKNVSLQILSKNKKESEQYFKSDCSINNLDNYETESYGATYECDSNDTSFENNFGDLKFDSIEKKLLNESVFANMLLSITDENEVKHLCKKILQFVVKSVYSERCSLFLIKKMSNKNKILEGYVFDITSIRADNNLNVSQNFRPKTSIASDCEEKPTVANIKKTSSVNNKQKCAVGKNDNDLLSNIVDRGSSKKPVSYNGSSVTYCETDAVSKVSVPWGTGIVGCSAKSGSTILVNNVLTDDRFYNRLDEVTGFSTRSVLCVPLKDKNKKVIGVMEAVNKKNSNENQNGQFTESDEKLMHKYALFCTIAVMHLRLLRSLKTNVRRVGVISKLNKIINKEDLLFEELLKHIVEAFIFEVQIERFSILVADITYNQIFSHIFDFRPSDDKTVSCPNKLSVKLDKIKVPIEIAIECVYNEKCLLYGKNENNDCLYKFENDINCCYTLPIYDLEQRLLCVLVSVNKINCHMFTKSDINLIDTAGFYIGNVLSNVNNRKDSLKSMHRIKVLTETLAYHVSPNEYYVQFLLNEELPKLEELNLNSFELDDSLLTEDQTIHAVYLMFKHLKLDSAYNISKETIYNWAVALKSNYRKVTYHNWRHAFNVGQSMFCVLYNTKIGKLLSNNEKCALMIGTLSHDVDHRGCNNGFYKKINSSLFELYSTSTLECHHFEQTLFILNLKNCQLLKNMYSDDIDEIIYYIEEAILATDLANYMKTRMEFINWVKEDSDLESGWKNNDQKIQLLKGMLMTLCDLNSLTKPWHVQLRCSKLVAEEFFEQGDLEKKYFNQEPIQLMDRMVAYQLPNLQVDFIDAMLIPLVENLVKICHELNSLSDNLYNNKNHWISLIGRFSEEAKKCFCKKSIESKAN